MSIPILVANPGNLKSQFFYKYQALSADQRGGRFFSRFSAPTRPFPPTLFPVRDHFPPDPLPPVPVVSCYILFSFSIL